MTEPPDDLAPHRIRLRGPWDYEWIKPPSGIPRDELCGEVRLPSSWADAFGRHLGTVRLSRRLGSPAEPDPTDRVWLEIASPAVMSVVLNGEWLGTVAPGAARLEATGRLLHRNRLDVDLTADGPIDGDRLLVEVALVFEPTG